LLLFFPILNVLDIGCCNSKVKIKNANVVGLDFSKLPDVDVVWNLEKTPYPFKSNQFDIVNASHVLEHIQNFLPLMIELNRITKRKGLIKIKVPFYSSWGQFNDPTHIRFFTPFSFDYFKDGNYFHETGGKVKFDVLFVRINFGVGKSKIMNKIFNPILNLNHKVYCRFFAWVFPAAEIEFELRPVKK
jgi:SAM-dependent methyltransferase